MNIFIRFRFGYYAYVDMREIKLKGGSIFFYNEKGDVVRCSLEDTAQFDIRVECGFRMTRNGTTPNFSKGDVFAIAHKGKEYDLYIPMSEVNFTKGHCIEQSMDCGMDIMIMQQCGIDATDLDFYNKSCNLNRFRSYQGKNGNRVLFEVFVGMKETDKGKIARNLSNEIRKDCDVSISSYDLMLILEKYRIEKR